MNWESFQIQGIGRCKPSPGWHMAKHLHKDTHELIVVLQGEIQTDFEDNAIQATVGDILFYPENKRHKEQSTKDPLETIYIGFRWKHPLDFPLQVHDHQGRIRTLALWLLETHQSGSTYALEAQHPLLQSILAEYMRLVHAEQDEFISRVRCVMRDHLTQPLSLEALAAEVNMSKYHFLRSYKDATGQTPMRDFRRLRVEHACDLMRTTSLTLREIAEESGFSDEYHLSRSVKKVLRITPTEYRGHRGRTQ